MQESQNNSTLIHVAVYGDGSKHAQTADEIYCSLPEGECGLRNDGKCSLCRMLFYRGTCPFGYVKTVKGYTRRALKHSEWVSHYRSMDCYSVLSPIGNGIYLRRASGYVFLNTNPLRLEYEVEEDGNGQVILADPLLAANPTWIPEKVLDVDVVIKIMKARPRSMFGEECRVYQEKVVPALMEDLKHHWVEMYEQIKEKEPSLCHLEVDWCGRYAYVATLRDGCVLPDSSGNKFVKQDGFLVCDNYHSTLTSPVSGGFAEATLSIPITEDMKVKVQDNNWVDPDTTTFA